MKQWEEKLWFYDFEVFEQDWLLCLNSYVEPDRWEVFHNDCEAVQKFIEENDILMCGYNNKWYDQYILKGVLCGYDPFVIKEINDWIIADGQQGWEYPFDYCVLPPQMDLILDIVPRKSLKEIEGNLGLDITETTIDFNDKRKWTKKMYEEILFYCKTDVSALRPLYEMRKNYIQTKLDIAREPDSGLDESKVMGMTNANVIADYLGCEKITFDLDEKYQFPKNIDIDTIREDIVDFYENMSPRYNYDGSINEDASPSYDTEIAGCPHKLGFGGLHGARLNYFEDTSSGERLILNYDAFSFYPSIMLINNHLSRAVHYVDKFKHLYEERKDSKFNPDSTVPKEKIPTIKLVMNTMYGISGAKFNKAYDPLQCKSVCVDGQVSLISLILELEKQIDSFTLIQSNTDGIMFSIDEANYAYCTSVIKDFENRTGFIMEEDRISKVCQRDVNNYLIVMDNGKIKCKGKLFAPLNKGKYEANSLKIVSTALQEYFANGTPVEKIINECDDIEQFQMIAKCGHTYNGGMIQYMNGDYPIQLQRCNRIFAGKIDAYGFVYKVKSDEEPYTIRRTAKQLGERALANRPGWSYIGQSDDGKYEYREERQKHPFIEGEYITSMDKVADCPPHAYVVNNLSEISVDNIDKVWYISYTLKHIKKFKGDDKMTTKKTEEKVKVEEKQVVQPVDKSVPIYDETIITQGRIQSDPTNRLKWLTKYRNMRKFFTESELLADGYNSQQKYEYVKGDTYRQALNDACLECGMEYFFDMDFTQQIELKSDKMILTRLQATITLVDIETGYQKNFHIIADGSDNMDKGIYKAETMGIKAFVQTNFLKGRTVDAEDGNGYTKPATLEINNHKPVPAETRAEIKKELTSNPEVASSDYLDKIVAAVLKVRETKPDFLADTDLSAVNDGTISQVDAVALYCKIEDEADELGVEI